MFWKDTLEGARDLETKAGRKPGDRRGPGFTVTELTQHVIVKATGRSSPEELVRSMIRKFVLWGYAVKLGSLEGPRERGRRWAVYTLTDWGMRVDLKREKAKKPEFRKVANPRKGEDAG